MFQTRQPNPDAYWWAASKRSGRSAANTPSCTTRGSRRHRHSEINRWCLWLWECALTQFPAQALMLHCSVLAFCYSGGVHTCTEGLTDSQLCDTGSLGNRRILKKGGANLQSRQFVLAQKDKFNILLSADDAWSKTFFIFLIQPLTSFCLELISPPVLTQRSWCGRIGDIAMISYKNIWLFKKRQARSCCSSI